MCNRQMVQGGRNDWCSVSPLIRKGGEEQWSWRAEPMTRVCCTLQKDTHGRAHCRTSLHFCIQLVDPRTHTQVSTWSPCLTQSGYSNTRRSTSMMNATSRLPQNAKTPGECRLGGWYPARGHALRHARWRNEANRQLRREWPSGLRLVSTFLEFGDEVSCSRHASATLLWRIWWSCLVRHPYLSRLDYL